MRLKRALWDPQGRRAIMFVQTVEISHPSLDVKHLSRLRPWWWLGDTSRIIGTAAHIANNRSLLYHCDGCNLIVHEIVYTTAINSSVIEREPFTYDESEKETAHGSIYMAKPGCDGECVGRKERGHGQEPKANVGSDKRKHWKCQLETSDNDSQ